MRKIIVTVAPVCHVGKEIPAECKNPLTPEEIAEDTINCYKAGACEVHLHTRDLQGNPTFELDVFRQTIGLIRKETDMIVQGSTGGLSTLTLAERCVSLDVPQAAVLQKSWSEALPEPWPCVHKLR
jgi:3-keto-5-aminohexanoate cleavage enzyme